MSYERWMNYIRNAEKTLFRSGKIRKVHYKFNDDKEMIEEYNIETGILMRRAWKKKQNIMGLHTEFNELNGSFFDWDIELGEIIRPTFDSNFLVKETDIMPIVTKRITRHNIEWRIRNLSYPIETYLIKVDNAKRSIVIRTTNKKYFKEIHVPELSRCNLLPQLDAMSIIHQHNTLIITVCMFVSKVLNLQFYFDSPIYEKPIMVRQMEQETLQMLNDVGTGEKTEEG